VALGFLTGATDCLGRESREAHEAMEKAIRDTVPAQFVSLNLQAFDLGYAQALRALPCG